MTDTPTKPEIALMPCPAECLHTVDRGPPEVFKRRYDSWGVYCQTCQCVTEYYPTEAEAIAAWHHRTPAHDAAPDLLEALQEAVAVYGKPGGPWNVPSDPGGWLDRARAAIARALPVGRG